MAITRKAIHADRVGFAATIAPALPENELEAFPLLIFMRGPRFGQTTDEKNVCSLKSFAPTGGPPLPDDPMYHFVSVIDNFRLACIIFGHFFDACLAYLLPDIVALCSYNGNLFFTVNDIYYIVNCAISAMGCTACAEGWHTLTLDDRNNRRIRAMRVSLESPIVQEFRQTHEYPRLLAAASSASALSRHASAPPSKKARPTGATPTAAATPTVYYAYDRNTEPRCPGPRPCRAWLNHHFPCFTSPTCLHPTISTNAGVPGVSRPHCFDNSVSPEQEEAYRAWAAVEED
jgi:hypothetical protein